MEYQTIVLAGLLHDIGKMLQKGSFGSLSTKGKHPEVSSSFIAAHKDHFAKISDLTLLQNLVMKHHEDEYSFPEHLTVQSAPAEILPLAYLVSRADNYSSSERGQRDSTYQDYKKRPLDSVFSRIELRAGKTDVLQYKMNEYNPDYCFPAAIKEHNENDINSHLQQFGKEFNQLLSKQSRFWTVYNQIYSLLMKYAWCIPSNTQEQLADVSLFDHLKTTSAIAASSYLYHEAINDFKIDSINNDQSDKFCLLVGDMSGIQSYLFSGAMIGAGGVAKRLRARSFSISMLTELVAYRIIADFNLPISNILMSSGGKFYILLPNLVDINERINAIQKQIDTQLMKQYQGELALNVALQTLTGKQFQTFGEVVREINNKLGIKKKMPFNDIIKKGNSWEEDSFIFQTKDTKGLGMCKGCGKEYAVSIVNDRGYGPKCLKDLEIGSKIPRLTGLTVNKSSDADILLENMGFNLITKDNAAAIKDSQYIAVNDNRILPEKSMTFKYLANYVPAQNGSTVSFDDIADKSKGSKRLAYLKADVDNLGNIFAFGLKTDEQNYDTISRITTLSRMLDVFFSGRVNNLLKHKFVNCYTVYSGGDDLLIIGPWNETIDFALQLQREFEVFTSFNKNITLSAGISFAKTKSPMVKAVERAEQLLEESKELVLKGKENGRNQVSIFDKTLSWQDLKEAVDDGKKLTSWIEDGRMQKSWLWKLRNYSLMYQDFLKNDNVEGLKYKAFLAYDIGRLIKERREDKEIISWLKSLFEMSSPRLINLGVIINYALSAIREGE